MSFARAGSLPSCISRRLIVRKPRSGLAIVAEAIGRVVAANHGAVASYGDDPITLRLEARFRDLFDTFNPERHLSVDNRRDTVQGLYDALLATMKNGRTLGESDTVPGAAAGAAQVHAVSPITTLPRSNGPSSSD